MFDEIGIDLNDPKIKKNILVINDSDFGLTVEEYFQPSYLPLFNPETNKYDLKDMVDSQSSIDFTLINKGVRAMVLNELLIINQDSTTVTFYCDGWEGIRLFKVEKTLLHNQQEPVQQPKFLWVGLLQKIAIVRLLKATKLTTYRQTLALGLDPYFPIPIADESIKVSAENSFKPAYDKPLFDPASQMPQAADIRQGRIGCCYLDAALMAIVQRHPQFIKQLFFAETKTHVVIQLYHKDGHKQYYQVHKSTIYDTRGALQYHRFLWVHLLEKALTIHYRPDYLSYPKSLSGGYPDNVLKQCLGHNLPIEIKDISVGRDNEACEVIALLTKWLADYNNIVTVSSATHSYSVKAIIKRTDSTFITVGNPHGHREHDFFSGFETYATYDFLLKFKIIYCIHLANIPAVKPLDSINLSYKSMAYAFIRSIATRLPLWRYIMPSERERAMELITNTVIEHTELEEIDTETSKILQKKLFILLHRACYRKSTLAYFLSHNWQLNSNGQYCSYGIRLANLSPEAITSAINAATTSLMKP